jgi:hypothetical protein
MHILFQRLSTDPIHSQARFPSGSALNDGWAR